MVITPNKSVHSYGLILLFPPRWKQNQNQTICAVKCEWTAAKYLSNHKQFILKLRASMQAHVHHTDLLIAPWAVFGWRTWCLQQRLERSDDPGPGVKTPCSTPPPAASKNKTAELTVNYLSGIGSPSATRGSHASLLFSYHPQRSRGMIRLQQHLCPVVFGSILIRLDFELLDLLAGCCRYRLLWLASRSILFIILIIVIAFLWLFVWKKTFNTRSDDENRTNTRCIN